MSALEPEIVEKGTLPPGECIFTKEWDGLIDTKRHLDYNHPVQGYIAVSYVQELATSLLDMVPRAELEAAQEAIAHLAEMVEEQGKRLEAYETLEETKAVAA